MRTGQRGDFINSLDQHSPCLTTSRTPARRCRSGSGILAGCCHFRFLAYAARLVRVPSVVANQVRSLCRNLLGAQFAGAVAQGSPAAGGSGNSVRPRWQKHRLVDAPGHCVAKSACFWTTSGSTFSSATYSANTAAGTRRRQTFRAYSPGSELGQSLPADHHT